PTALAAARYEWQGVCSAPSLRRALRAAASRRPKSFQTILSRMASSEDGGELRPPQLGIEGRLARLRLAEIDLVPRARDHAKARRAHQRFDAGVVGRPPVRRVLFELTLDEGHERPARLAHQLALAELDRLRGSPHRLARHGERLQDHPAGRQPSHHVQREQRMAQVIQHAEEADEVELLPTGGELVDGGLPERQVGLEAELARRPAGLLEIARLDVDRGDLSTAPRELEAVEPGVAADVE